MEELKKIKEELKKLKEEITQFKKEAMIINKLKNLKERGFNGWQRKEIEFCLRRDYPIDKYIAYPRRPASEVLEQIACSFTDGLTTNQIDKFANGKFCAEQMCWLRIATANKNVDENLLLNPKFDQYMLPYIVRALEEGVPIEKLLKGYLKNEIEWYDLTDTIEVLRNEHKKGSV